MSGEQMKKLEQQLWNIANTLCGRMDADEFRDDILGFIFFRHLSEKQYLFGYTIFEIGRMAKYAYLKCAF